MKKKDTKSSVMVRGKHGGEAMAQMPRRDVYTTGTKSLPEDGVAALPDWQLKNPTVRKRLEKNHKDKRPLFDHSGVKDAKNAPRDMSENISSEWRSREKKWNQPVSDAFADRMAYKERAAQREEMKREILKNQYQSSQDKKARLRARA